MKRLGPWMGILLFVITGANLGRGAEGPLTPQAQLRKLSIHLRGYAPAREEYDALAVALPQHRLDVFLRDKAKEYLATPAYQARMHARLEGLFRLRQAHVPEELPYREAPWVQGQESALDQLFYRIIRQNLSWDQLLLAKSYPFIPVGDSSFAAASDLGFFNAVDSNLPPSVAGIIRKKPPLSNLFGSGFGPNQPAPQAVEARFAPTDSRVAGALTTQRFALRYSTTQLNRNRRRAAAVFRIFLCDDMQPVVMPNPAETDDLICDALGGCEKVPPPASPVHATAADERRHGADPACMSCHYKLDPMGQAFRGMGAVLSEKAAPGALVFRRADGSLVNVAGRGLGDVAAAIAEQPEYASCQVRHFWNWFVGEDLPLTPAREAALVAQFNSVGRRVNDFVAYLVEQPEFRGSGAGPSGTTLSQVKPVLDRCVSCHGVSVPNFTTFPIGGSLGKHRTWIAAIAQQMDLAGDGAKRTMPPKASVWQPTAEDFALLKRWIREGARDAHGLTTVDPSDGEKLVGVTPSSQDRRAMKFHGTSLRYRSGTDLIRALRYEVPSPGRLLDCMTEVMPQDRGILGMLSPATGMAQFPEPSPAFLRWLTGCALNVASEVHRRGLFDDASPFLSPATLQTLRGLPYGPPGGRALDYVWADLPAPYKADVARDVMRTLVGPDVSPREREESKRLAQGLKLPKEARIHEAIKQLIVLVLVSDAYLTY